MALVEQRQNVVATVGDERRTVPHIPQLEDFIESSRRQQTQYLNNGGGGDKFEFEYDQKNVMEKFIATSLFFNKISTDGKKQQEEWLQLKVKEIAETLIHYSERVNSKKIHFSIIWVNYFVYEEKKHKRLPLFKIYKNSGGAMFMDACLKVFSDWEHFIGEEGLPRALLCVPRNGKYDFVQGQLDLEYVNSKILVKELTSAYAEPHSEVGFLHRWIKTLQSWFSRLKSGVVHMVLRIKEKHPVCYYFAAGSIVVAIMALPYASNYILSLFSWILKGIGMTSEINISGYWSELLGVLKPLIKEVFSSSEEGRILLRLLDNPKKNWVDILKFLNWFLKKVPSEAVTAKENLPLKVDEGKNTGVCGKEYMKENQIAASERVSASSLNSLIFQAENTEGIGEVQEKFDLTEFWADFASIWENIMPELSLMEVGSFPKAETVNL